MKSKCSHRSLIAIVLMMFPLIYWLTPSIKMIYENNEHITPKPNVIQNIFYHISSPSNNAYISQPTFTSSSSSDETTKPANSTFGQPNAYKAQNESENYQIAYLKYKSGRMPMCVHNQRDLISSHMLRSGSWEAGHISAMEDWFDKMPDLNLIDVGCNLGVFSLVAAKHGHRAIAVDANINNIRRLSKSVFQNNIQEKVTIVHNAISDTYSYFSVSSPDPGNIGHSEIINSDKANNQQTKLKSIYMDDLLKVIDFKQAILKIDIEGHEFEALKKADKLFTNLEIVAVMMEWNWLKTHRDANAPVSVKTFFNKYGYKAYPSLNSNNLLNQEDYQSWPWDIVWKKRS